LAAYAGEYAKVPLGELFILRFDEEKVVQAKGDNHQNHGEPNDAESLHTRGCHGCTSEGKSTVNDGLKRQLASRGMSITVFPVLAT